MRRLIHLRFLAWTILDAVVLLLPPGWRQPRRVAVVRLDRIGDAILWLPAAAAARRSFPAPAWHLELVTTAAAAGIMRASGMFDAVWTVDPERMRRNPLHRMRILCWMRRAGWSEVVQPAGSRCIADGDALVRASGAPSRIGAEDDGAITPPWLSRWADRWYTRLIPVRQSGSHELERNRAFVAAWSGVDADCTPRLVLSAQPPVSGAYAVIVPGAHWSGRRWPAAGFAAIAARIHAAWGWHIVLAGSAAERPLAMAVMAATPDVPCVDQTGGNTPLEMAAVMAGAGVVVTNDTAAVHLAAAVGVAAVAVAGGGHVGRFLPYPAGFSGAVPPTVVSHHMPCFDCDWQCIHHPRPGEAMPCIAAVSVEDVWLAVLAAVGQRAAHPLSGA